MKNNVIWKFPLIRPSNSYGRIEIDMPFSAEILSCQEQNGQLFLWAMVDTENPVRPRAFYIAGTGKQLNTDIPLKFIDTVKQGVFVWHVFETK